MADERAFFDRHMAPIITAIVSVAATIVSIAQLRIQSVQHAAEMQNTERDRQDQFEQAIREQDRRYNLDLADLLFRNQARLFSASRDDQQRAAAIIFATVPLDVARQAIGELNASGTVADTSVFNRLQRRADSAAQLAGPARIIRLYTRPPDKARTRTCWLQSAPVQDQIWTARGVPLNTAFGIGRLINPIRRLPGEEAFAMQIGCYDDQTPDADSTALVFQFDKPATVVGALIYGGANAVTQVEGFAGSASGHFASVGRVFGSYGDPTGINALPSESVDTFAFQHPVSGTFFKVTITRSNAEDHFGFWRIYLRDSTGAFFYPR
jgi:hypothetical protein